MEQGNLHVGESAAWSLRYLVTLGFAVQCELFHSMVDRWCGPSNCGLDRSKGDLPPSTLRPLHSSAVEASGDLDCFHRYCPGLSDQNPESSLFHSVDVTVDFDQNLNEIENFSIFCCFRVKSHLPDSHLP